MQNIIIGYPNHVDATYFPVAFTPGVGGWEVDLPLTNLIDPDFAVVARSTSADSADTQFEIDFGVERTLRVFAIPVSNITRIGQMRIRGSNTSLDYTTSTYDSGWFDVWPIIYEWGSLPWGHPSWYDGKLSAENAADYDIPMIWISTADVVGRYAYIEVSDETNPDGYVEFARLYAMPGWQPPINIDNGMQFGVTTATTMEESIGGSRYYGRQKPRRWLRCAISNLEEDIALAQPFEMFRQQGIDREVMVIIDADDSANLHRWSFPATFKELSALEFPVYGRSNVPFHFEEKL